MSLVKLNVGDCVIVEANQIQTLIGELRKQRYQVIGPTIRDGAIVYDEIDASNDLPIGWADEQDGGHYRLDRRKDDKYFGFTAPAQSLKKYFLPANTTLWKARRNATGFRLDPESAPSRKRAFLGVRACDLSAALIQDRVFLKGAYVDPVYKANRENAFIVAINCTEAGGTCFCASMGTGPRAPSGYDLALTELLDERRHEFQIDVGTEAGANIVAHLRYREVTEVDRKTALEAVWKTETRMGRMLDTEGIKDILYRNAENPRWSEIATRCLSCTNCTMVCPTCFCTTFEDVTDLSGEFAERQRRWDSCFTLDFSYIHGGSVRFSTAARYRHWMTHKLATWYDQFGTTGCVGCGRCIAWCPAAIDITEEARAIRESELVLKEQMNGA